MSLKPKPVARMVTVAPLQLVAFVELRHEVVEVVHLLNHQATIAVVAVEGYEYQYLL